MTKKYKLLLIGLVLAIGGLVLVPQGFLEKLGRSYVSNAPANFLIQEVVGRVERRALSATRFETVSSKSALQPGDMIVTHGDSKVLLNFDPPFWLMPYSKMEFLRREEGWIGHLIYGELKKLPNLSNNSKIDLIYDDKIIEQDQFSSSEEALIANVLPVNESTFKDLSMGREAPPQNIIEKQIYQTLLLHKKFFQGCLIKYYKTQSGQITGGESVFDLRIDITGAIETSRVTRTDINDTDYLDCLKSVFARIRFKNLPIKEPLHATFPLSIELPE